ncbi:MAG: glycosyltransferase family 39 protein, partial [Thermoflexus sp.]|uniref:ArnT family glycosyltransferase n=1 Tax=Thermoflexus sp. TaxID=1969742 RepID=UPI0025D6CDA0
MEKSDYRIALFLFGLFTAIYWATFGGHTYSPDEEMIYYVTEGIIERGSLAVPAKTETSSISTGARGADGKNYAITGILQSLLAIPFYLIGRIVADIFPAGFQAYWTRFFVNSLNGLVGGAIVGLLYLSGRWLGYQHLTSLFLSISIGLSTFIHIYSRTFFSEPLVTLWLLLSIYAAFSYRRSSRPGWGVILGLALGLAVATKPQASIAGISFVIYLIIVSIKDYSEWKYRLVWLRNITLYSIIGAAVPIVLVLLYNYIRFRNPFETGYTAILPLSYFRGAGLEAIYGFL